MRDLMGPPAQAPAGEQTTNHNWQGGNEHVLMDASYYLDDLLRNMQGNAVDGDTPGGIRGASQLQVSLRLQRLLVHSGSALLPAIHSSQIYVQVSITGDDFILFWVTKLKTLRA